MSGVENFCKGCIYYGKLSGIPCCLYCYITGHSRRCQAGNGCDKKVIGTRNYVPSSFTISRSAGSGNPDVGDDIQNPQDAHAKREFAERNRAMLKGRQKAAITEFRVAHGWTVKDMALRLGVKESTFKKWITEYSKANWEILSTVGLSKPDGLP